MQSLIALASAFTTALYFVYVSQIMKERVGLSSTLTLAVSHLIAALALLPLWLTHFQFNFATLLFPPVLQAMLLASLLLLISRELYFYAYARTDVANITVFSALTPMYALGIAFFILDEVPSQLDLVGMLLICGSIYALFLKPLPGLAFVQNIVQPFRHIASSKPIFCAFLSTIPTAFAATFQKQLMSVLDPFTFSFFLLLLIGLIAAGVSLVILKPAGTVAQLRRLPLSFLLASALMLPIMHILFCLVIAEQQTAVSLVLQRLSILFQVILAFLFLHERQDFRKRLIVAICIIIGFLLIMA